MFRDGLRVIAEYIVDLFRLFGKLYLRLLFSERNARQYFFNLFDFVPIKKQSAGIFKHISEQSSVTAKAQIIGTRNSRTVLSPKISANQYWNRTIHKKCRLKYGKDLCDMYSDTEFL